MNTHWGGLSTRMFPLQKLQQISKMLDIGDADIKSMSEFNLGLYWSRSPLTNGYQGSFSGVKAIGA